MKAKAQAAYSEARNTNGSVNTPERELAIVRSFGSIGLDPCSNRTSVVGARIEFRGRLLRERGQLSRVLYRDGLVELWGVRLRSGEHVYSNPPYGTEALLCWGEKYNFEAQMGVEIIALLPGRFETKWFRALNPDRICWYGRRIAFVDAKDPERDSSAKFPSVFCYWGRNAARFETIFGAHGVVTPWRKR